jgi:hypothetical protein
MTDPMTDLVQAINDLLRLDQIEAEVKAIHDRVSGQGMYLVESDSALGELGHDIRGDLHLAIGRIVAEQVLAPEEPHPLSELFSSLGMLEPFPHTGRTVIPDAAKASPDVPTPGSYS